MIFPTSDGWEWRFFTDLVDKNVMDREPFLSVDFSHLADTDVSQLGRFRHDRFQPEALRTLAEESVFLTAFKAVVKKSVLECDADFVRYVAGKSTIQRTLTAKFMESITPIVKQAKVNRWLLRFSADKKRPTAQFIYAISCGGVVAAGGSASLGGSLQMEGRGGAGALFRQGRRRR